MFSRLLQHLDTVFSFIGFITVVGGAVYAVIRWVAKSAVTYYLERKKEEYKAQLESDKEKYRHELQQMAFVSQTQFAHLYAKRAEAILEFHALFVKTFRAFNAVAYKSADRAELQKNTVAFNKLKARLYETQWFKRLYFTGELAEKLNGLIFNLDAALGPASSYVTLRLQDSITPRNQSKLEQVQQYTEAKIKEMEQAVAQIEDEFRVLLGVETKKQTR